MSKVILINGCAGCGKTQAIIDRVTDLSKNIKNKILILSHTNTCVNEIVERLDDSINVFAMTVTKWINIQYREICSLHTDYDLKIKYLQRIMSKKSTPIYAGEYNATHIFIDELQDIDLNIIKLFKTIISKNRRLYFVACGDTFQTFSKNDEYSMNSFRTIVDEEIYLNITYRSPKKHIKFRNSILSYYTDMFHIPEMVSYKNGGYFPYLFTYNNLNSENSLNIANMIHKCINDILENDNDILVKDIAVIVRKSSNSFLLDILENIFPDLHISSINKIKGMTFKCVFVIGLSREGTGDDMIDGSLINVACTRSTRYLFIGFNSGCPMSIFKDATSCYKSWMEYNNMNEKICNIHQIMKEYGLDDAPNFEWIKKDDKIYNIREISEKYNYKKVGIKINKISEIVFGKKINNINIHENTYSILGILVELMICKYHDFDRFRDIIFEWRDSYFTDDLELLCRVYDNCINLSDLKTFTYFLKNNKLSHIIKNKMNIVSKKYKNLNFDKLLKNDDKNIWWNFAIYYCDIISRFPKIAMYKFINSYTPDIDDIIQNVKQIKWYKNMKYSYPLKYKNIHGICDFCGDNRIVEIKACFDEKMENWITQSALYALILDKPKCSVINIMSGRILEFEVVGNIEKVYTKITEK